MLTLITGQPGNGKSLYTISFVEAKRQAESRPVFYYGIPELTLPWTQLEDPTKWYECPEKSIIVIDEVQNCTYGQIKMMLTRLGWHSTMVLTGDPDQSDLLPGMSGLATVGEKLSTLEDVGVIHLGDRDIVRHPLVAGMLTVL